MNRSAPDPRLGAGKEFDLIRSIAERLGPRAGELGDDCAAVPWSGGTLILSTDLTVEGVHYRSGWLTAVEVGYRAASAALSDLAAAGAEPIGVMASVGGNDEAVLLEMMDGVGRSAVEVGAVVLGGDVSRSDTAVIDICGVGSTEHPITRSGARAGDGLWLTGNLGGARAALTTWQGGGTPEEEVRIAFAAPRPRIAAGRWLAEHGARAMIDVSDGLASDVSHLAARSRLAVRVDLALLPLGAGVAAAARGAGEEPAVFAARGGEDYELLAALPEAFGAADAAEFEAACELPLTRIGAFEEGAGSVLLLDGVPQDLTGFGHF